MEKQKLRSNKKQRRKNQKKNGNMRNNEMSDLKRRVQFNVNMEM